MRLHRRTGHSPTGRPDKQARKAIEWLRVYLSDGDKPAKDIENFVTDHPEFGFSFRTLNRAKVRYGIVSYRPGNGGTSGPWIWTLQNQAGVIETRQRLQEREEAKFDAEIAKLENRDKGRQERWAQKEHERMEELISNYETGQTGAKYISSGHLIWELEQYLSKHGSDKRLEEILVRMNAKKQAEDEERKRKQAEKRELDDLFA